MSLDEQTLYQRRNQEPRKIITRCHDETKTRAIASHSDGIFNTCVTFLIGSYSRKFATDPRIRSSRAMSDARASSSAMSLDAASELSRTDKRPPTCPPSPRRYFSSARSGRYPPPHPDSLPMCRHPCFVQAR